MALLFRLYEIATPRQDSEHQVYSYYIDLFKTDLSDETIQAIETERQNLINMSNGDQRIISTELKVLDRIEKQINLVWEVEEKTGIEARLINDNTYFQIMDDSNLDNRDILLIFLFTIFAIAGIFSKENTYQTTKLLRISPEYKKLRRSKIYLSILISLFITSLVTIFRFLEWNKIESIKDLDAPIQSHMYWHDFPLKISLAQYIVLLILLKLVCAVVHALVISAVSSSLRNQNLAMTVLIVISVFPIFLHMIHSRQFQCLTLAWIAEANVLLNSSVIYWIWAAIFLFILIMVSMKVVYTKWQPQVLLENKR